MLLPIREHPSLQAHIRSLLRCLLHKCRGCWWLPNASHYFGERNHNFTFSRARLCHRILQGDVAPSFTAILPKLFRYSALYFISQYQCYLPYHVWQRWKCGQDSCSAQQKRHSKYTQPEFLQEAPDWICLSGITAVFIFLVRGCRQKLLSTKENQNWKITKSVVMVAVVLGKLMSTQKERGPIAEITTPYQIGKP